ncbi:pyrimidine reductase family protein [Mycobacterium sp. Y57]|uniref:pyrimidine reductase family protein n=1 Tax=Mycolicibacterium xanthum TaxID=2796469 RepID=UPI001C843569|nr:pyrimidine reductase family protein [Mycolicibacterium xanthum]MBX7432823.1 pyrimidine reductase family protein [Mycolicibacterium xanthum]
MSEQGDGTQFTMLGSAGRISGRELVARYSYPDRIATSWVRGNMVSSADGGATSGGKSGALGGDGDRAVFAALRELADVIVVGASTARVENYSGVQFSAVQREERRRRGQSEVPPIAVLTRSGRLDREAKLFHRTEVAPLVLTCTEATAATRSRLGGLAEVIDCSGVERDSVDLRRALGELADRGLTRVLTEGGPGILAMFIAADLLDEMCLTLAPVLVGGESGRIVSGPGEARAAMTLQQVLTDEDGYLFLRYTRDRTETTG